MISYLSLGVHHAVYLNCGIIYTQNCRARWIFKWDFLRVSVTLSGEVNPNVRKIRESAKSSAWWARLKEKVRDICF